MAAAITKIRGQGHSVEYDRRGGVWSIALVHQQVGGDFYRVRALALLFLAEEGARVTRQDRRMAEEVLARGGRRPEPVPATRRIRVDTQQRPAVSEYPDPGLPVAPIPADRSLNTPTAAGARSMPGPIASRGIIDIAKFMQAAKDRRY